MDLEALLDKIRRRAPRALDFDGLVARVRTRNMALIAELRERVPSSTSAVLEVIVHASGHSRRRLRRYEEFRDARGGQPGVLVFSQAVMLGDSLDYHVVRIAAAAARAEVVDIEWRLLTVSEALAAPP